MDACSSYARHRDHSTRILDVKAGKWMGTFEYCVGTAYYRNQQGVVKRCREMEAGDVKGTYGKTRFVLLN